jgi:hypothetical protein
MFRALLAHPQEVLYKRHFVYCVRIMSVICGTVARAIARVHFGHRSCAGTLLE